MGSNQATTLILFVHILLLMCSYGSGTTAMPESRSKEDTRHELDDTHQETSPLRLRSMDTDDRLQMGAKQDADEQGMVHAHPHGQATHINHMNTLLNVFIMEKNLMDGYTMPIYFPNPSSPHFLPREEAESIPFSTTQLPYLLEMFSFSNESHQAQAMRDTLRQCEIKPIAGETKFCATSLESMREFASSIFGSGSQFDLVRTIHHRESTNTYRSHRTLQNYTILNVPTEISAAKKVACHTLPYPYPVFYCHYQKSESKIFRVEIRGENGERVDAIVVCHMDTSAWDSTHVSFRVLQIKPGTVPVCHFFPENHLVWVPLSSSM